MSKNEHISHKRESLVLQRTKRSWLLASDSMDDMRQGIKGARARDLSFYLPRDPACVEKVGFNNRKESSEHTYNSPAIRLVD